jgi:cell division protein FtsB
MNVFRKILSIFINRYFLVLVGFIVWMLFFDERDYFQQKASAEELNKLEAKRKYLKDEINNTNTQLNNFQNDPVAIEKYGRERYLLKRDGEEVYILDDTTANKTTLETR